MTEPNPNARRTRVWLTVAAALAVLVGYVEIFAATGRGFPCILHAVTGWQCGACGLTRAAAALLRLDLAAAFSCNLLWPLFAAYGLWIVVSDAVVYVRTGELRLLPAPWWLHLLLLIAVVGYGILRNLA